MSWSISEILKPFKKNSQSCTISFKNSRQSREFLNLIIYSFSFLKQRHPELYCTLVMFSICASSLSDSPVFPVWSRSELNDWHKFRISSKQCDTCQSSESRYYFFNCDTLFLIQPAISRSLVSAKVGGKENKGKRPPDCRLFLIMHPGHFSTETWRNMTKQAHGSPGMAVLTSIWWQKE